MSERMVSGRYVVRHVGSSCCNPSIDKKKLNDIINEMDGQGYEYVDLYLDMSYKCGCFCPDRAAVMIFKSK